MASVTITISREAHGRLRKRQEPGESISDLILRELPEPCDTAGEVLAYLEKHGVPKANPKLERAMLAGRGRRSPRKL